jgi:signal transduction histidine kinase
LIAVVPLAVVMVLFSQRMRTVVRSEAAERLSGALGAIEARLDSDGRRLSEKLAILGRDPLLKRLYLLRPHGGRDLTDYLSERRVLLDVDFLQVADTSGALIAEDAAVAPPIVIEDLDSSAAGAKEESVSRGVIALERRGGVPGLAMAASGSIRYENQVVGRVRGGRVLDAAFLENLKRESGMDLILIRADGSMVAGTLAASGRVTPIGVGIARVEIAGRRYLGRGFALGSATPRAAMVGLVSTAPSDRAVSALQIGAGALGAIGVAIAIVLGLIWSSQISRPVEELAAFSHRVAQGEWDEPLALRSVRELETLVQALDRMRRDLTTYRARLKTSERQAAWSQMARKVAHEVKNPLTPIAISVADLKRSFELERPDFPRVLDRAVRTIGEEVDRLKRMLQEFSDFARLPAPRLAPVHLPGLLAGLETLYGRDVAEGRLAFTRPVPEITLSADADQLKQALVNLIKNGLEAADGSGRVTVSASIADATGEIVVHDSGPGLGEETRRHLFEPGFTTKSAGSGLGLTIVERIVNDHGGTIAVDDPSPAGTSFRIRLPLERT